PRLGSRRPSGQLLKFAPAMLTEDVSVKLRPPGRYSAPDPATPVTSPGPAPRWPRRARWLRRSPPATARPEVRHKQPRPPASPAPRPGARRAPFTLIADKAARRSHGAGPQGPAPWFLVRQDRSATCRRRWTTPAAQQRRPRALASWGREWCPGHRGPGP